MTRIPGDYSDADIERRYQLARWDLRHGGTGELARGHDRIVPPIPVLRTCTVLAAFAAHGPSTIGEIARRLGRTTGQIWGHVVFLRKSRKVEVLRYVTSAKRRKVAVYQVMA